MDQATFDKEMDANEGDAMGVWVDLFNRYVVEACDNTRAANPGDPRCNNLESQALIRLLYVCLYGVATLEQTIGEVSEAPERFASLLEKMRVRARGRAVIDFAGQMGAVKALRDAGFTDAAIAKSLGYEGPAFGSAR